MDQRLETLVGMPGRNQDQMQEQLWLHRQHFFLNHVSFLRPKGKGINGTSLDEVHRE